MLKKFFYGMMAATMLVATSCTDDPMVDPAGETSTVSFSISTPEIATRTFNDGKKATQLQYAVYDAQGNILDGFTTTNATINISTTVDLQLTTGNTYYVLFWAATPNTTYYKVDLTNKKMEVNYTGAVSNDENRDAFYAYEKVEVTGNLQKRVELRRPFAQLNIGTNDLAASETAGYKVLQSWVSVPVYSGMDLSTGEVVGTPEVKKFALANIPSGETFPVSGYDYLAMNYLLVGGIAEPELVEVEFGYTNTANFKDANKKRKVGSVPLRRNYRTNLYGQLLTSNAKIEVVIEPVPETLENIEIKAAASKAELENLLAAGESNIYLVAGEYTMPAGNKFTSDDVITCAEGVVFTGKSGLDINGATIVGATFSNPSGTTVSGTIDGTFKGCKFEGSEVLRWCYTTSGEEIVFEDCEFKTDFRGVHFDTMDGNVTFRNCFINGFNAFGGTGTMTFEGCTFGNDQSSYNGLNIYTNTVIKNSKFVFVSGKTNFIDMEGVGQTLTITNCTATLDGVDKNIEDFVGGSKLNQNTVVIN